MWTFRAELWLWEAKEPAQCFITVPEAVSDEIADVVEGELRRGFGSVRVRVRCGSTTWGTSVFPSVELKAYVLPVKKAVREAETLAVGTAAHYVLQLA